MTALSLSESGSVSEVWQAGRQSPQVDGTDIIMMEVRCVMTIVRQYLLQASLASDSFDTGIFMHADA